ncbi:hypothetical protein EUX98_g2927 [Antrodiella citrinella]|uniref:BTB domain-containing protein n=1 Tax=Antrodiella citrinella TaxID=2447956 RepID=A0A4S4N0P0_9APHY|nr:hypothetical protein EUX98_g2927 [Antrodiella citrinella]
MLMHPTSPPAFCATNDSTVDASYGDIIIRSSDDVDFRVAKHILSKGSDVFNDMFALPSPPSDSDPMRPYNAGEVHIVPITESSAMVAQFLKTITSDPSTVAFRTMNDIREFYLMGDKYVSDGAMQAAKKALARRAQNSPLEVYVMACRLGLEAEARIAAKRSLSLPLASLKESSGEYTDDTMAPAFERLWAYYEQCSTAVAVVAHSEYWAIQDLKIFPVMMFDPRIPPPPSVFSTRPYCCTVPQTGSELHEYHVKSWYLPFLAKLSALLAVKPSGEDIGFSEWTALFPESVSQAKRCPDCGPHAFDLLRSYSKRALSRVETLVNGIRVEYREI